MFLNVKNEKDRNLETKGLKVYFIYTTANRESIF